MGRNYFHSGLFQSAYLRNRSVKLLCIIDKIQLLFCVELEFFITADEWHFFGNGLRNDDMIGWVIVILRFINF